MAHLQLKKHFLTTDSSHLERNLEYDQPSTYVDGSGKTQGIIETSTMPWTSQKKMEDDRKICFLFSACYLHVLHDLLDSLSFV